MADELDLTQNTWLFVMDVAAFDRPDRFQSAQGCFGGSQGPAALTIFEALFPGGVIAFNQVVAPLSADADVGFVHMPIDAGPAQMFLCALGQVRTELLHPAKYRRAINRDVAFSQ